jgi:hypothetical protein
VECCDCSKRIVISTGNHALRGTVNWGAEKNRTLTCVELETEKSDPHKTRKSHVFYPIVIRLSFRYELEHKKAEAACPGFFYSFVFKTNGGADGDRTRDLRRDRPAF